MQFRTKRAAAIAAATAGLALALATASPSYAISRSVCGSEYLQLFSSNTTCWANAGTASVALYGVVGLSSGNNAGYITGPSISVVFAKYVSHGWAAKTVTTVHIN